MATTSGPGWRWHDLMDVNAGAITDGDAMIEEVGWAIFRTLLRNALVLFNPAPVT